MTSGGVDSIVEYIDYTHMFKGKESRAELTAVMANLMAND